MSQVLRPSIKPHISILLVLLGLSACGGTLEVRIERTATPEQATATPTPWLTPTPHMDHWVAYSNPALAISLEYPVNWQPVPGYSVPETGETRFAGDNGFFHAGTLDVDTLDAAAAIQAGHVLQPYGSQPIIENLQIQGQEARLIMPSQDQAADLDNQAALIVSYPQPVNVYGTSWRYFVLWADYPHIRTIAQTLQFIAGSSPAAAETPAPPMTGEDQPLLTPDEQLDAHLMPVPPIIGENLPPGLVFSTSEGLWVVQGDGRALMVHNDSQAVLSPDGTQLLSYDSAQQDLWLLDLAEGAIWNLTKRPDRTECCVQWWPQRPDVVLFSSAARDVERAPGSMGYLSAVGIDGQGYQVLDAVYDTGPGGFAPSPDGQTIAYGDGSAGWLYRWGGSEVFDPWDYGLIVRDGVEIARPAWSPDGVRLAWLVKANLAVDGSLRAGVGVFDVEARTARVLHPYEPQGSGWSAAPAWSPDGQWLAFGDSSASDQAGLWVARTDGLWEEHHLGLGGNPVWSPDGKWLAFQSFAQHGPPVYVLAKAGTWELRTLDLAVDRYGMLVDWIDLAEGF